MDLGGFSYGSGRFSVKRVTDNRRMVDRVSTRTESHQITELSIDGVPIELSGAGTVSRHIRQIDAGNEQIDGTWTWDGSAFTRDDFSLPNADRSGMRTVVMQLDDGRRISTPSRVVVSKARNGVAITLQAGDEAWTEVQP